MPTMKSIKFPGYDESFEVVDAAARERLDNQDKTIGDKLDADKLPEAINTALAQAKESGEFNGENGVSPTVTASKSGKATTITISDVNGTRETVINDGADGVSPAIAVSAITGGHRITITDADGSKTVDVMDGGKGSDGRGIRTIARTSGSGASGTTDTYTITYTDGTTSTFGVYNGKDGTNGASVTVKSVSESTVDGGSNVVEFSDGKTVTIKNGSKGTKGDTGYTPQKGVDYATEADKAEMVSAVIAALPDASEVSY